MSDMIYILLIIIIIAVLIVWYISSTIKQKSNNAELILDTDEDKILFQYLEENKKIHLNVNLTNEAIIAKLIKKIYDFNVDIDHIIIGNNVDGNNLEEQYYNITKKNIGTKFSENEDCLLYLRSIIGINYQVCIINSSKNLYNKLISSNIQDDDINLCFLNDVIDSNLEKIAYDHIRKVINIRWQKILEINDKLERTVDDSFLYLDNNIPNLISYSTSKGNRINLLCNNTEFEALMYRLRSNKPTELQIEI